MTIPDPSRRPLPMSDEGAEHTLFSHPCRPLIIFRHFCPCELACALVCAKCKWPVLFIHSGTVPECDHSAEVTISQGNGWRDWWGARGDGRIDEAVRKIA